MDNKITDKFIPKTNSHTSSRISHIVKKINKDKKKNKKQIGIKTYKKKYQKKLLKKSSKNKKSKSKTSSRKSKKSKSKSKSKTKKHSRKSQLKSKKIKKTKSSLKNKQLSKSKSNSQLKTRKDININKIIKNDIVIPDMIISNNKQNNKQNNDKIILNNLLNTKNLSIINQLTSKTTKTNKTSKTTKPNKTKYIIAIPSYNRPELIQVKTLALLHKHNINSKLINIFVSDREQYDLYKLKVPEFLYNKLIIGVKGLKNQRNYINAYYPEGYPIVEMDDDIDKIVELHSNTTTKTKTLIPIEDLDAFIKKAFKMCYKKNIFLWGVYPLANSHFMTEKITTDLRFIVGPMWGMINRHHKDLVLTIDEKEDTERTLQHWVMDGKVLRFNTIGIETNYYKNKGGMQNEGKNRKEEALKSVYYLHKKYPELTKIHLGKKSGFPEIKLIK